MKTLVLSCVLLGGVMLAPADAQNYQQTTQKKPAATVTTPASGGFLGGGGDDCLSSEQIVGPGIYNFALGTTGAQGQNEALCYAFGTSGIENDVWFKWISTCDSDVTVTTCGGTASDTKIAAYDFQSGGCPADGTALACNDDACGLQSTISFLGVGGATYSIQIGTFPGATNQGGGTFEIACQALNDYPYCISSDGGTQQSCPCGNESDFGGCSNSSGLGAALISNVQTSIAADILEFTVVQAPANQPVIVFSADNIHRRPLGDGIRCAGDNAIRLVTGVTDGGGNFATGTGLIAKENNPQPGDVRRYQGWFRDPQGPCGNGNNLTQGWSHTFTP